MAIGATKLLLDPSMRVRTSTSTTYTLPPASPTTTAPTTPAAKIFVDFKDSPDSMVPTLKWLIDHGLPVWLFSGDLDSRCPITSTRHAIRDLNLSVAEPWRPWTAGHEIGGYVQQYKGGFTFATVRGAGHTVPTFQPERALILLQSFLKGILPPYEKAK
uniref:Serine carboxypeptidase-like 40 n=1 Tax=Aegilops tauschii TaxID=37682 RepID=M8BZI2_AEGTA